MTTLKIGVVGYSGQKFDEEVARAALNERLSAACEGHQDVTIVAGMADVGIASIAYRIAQERGWKTLAIDCARSRKYLQFPVDDMIVIESMTRGSESETFLGECDVLVRIGGGDQAMSEMMRFKETGRPVYEFDLPPLPS